MINIGKILRKGILVSLMLGMLSATAAVAEDITVTVYATASSADDSVWLGRGALQQSVIDHMTASPAMIKITPADPSNQPQEMFLQWHDSENSSSIPIFTLNAFSGSNLTVFFSRQEVTADNVSTLLSKQCKGNQPQNQQEAFRMIYVCRSVYLYVKDIEHGRLTRPLRNSLNTWFIANNYLYKQPSGKVFFSPFGFQDDLIQELQTFIKYVDDNRYSSSDFSPLSIDDIKAALQSKQTENIRMAGFVPGLIKAGNLNEAGYINSGALATFKTLADGKHAGVVIEGVTEKVLLKNQNYIQTLSK